MISLKDYCNHDGLGLADLVASGEVTPGELADAAWEAMERLNPELNAVLQVLRQEASAEIAAGLPEIVAQMDELNAAEEQEHGDDDGGGGLPEELQLRERRRERIRAAREQLEREKGEKLEAKHQKSFADPEANMMKTEGSLQYCYNAQLATSEDGLIVANELTEKANDYEQLEPMVEAIETNTSQRAGILLADNGYLSESNLKALERAGTTGVDRGPRAEVVPLAQGSPGAADAPDLTTALGPSNATRSGRPRRSGRLPRSRHDSGFGASCCAARRR